MSNDVASKGYGGLFYWSELDAPTSINIYKQSYPIIKGGVVSSTTTTTTTTFTTTSTSSTPTATSTTTTSTATPTTTPGTSSCTFTGNGATVDQWNGGFVVNNAKFNGGAIGTVIEWEWASGAVTLTNIWNANIDTSFTTTAKARITTLYSGSTFGFQGNGVFSVKNLKVYIYIPSIGLFGSLLHLFPSPSHIILLSLNLSIYIC